MAHPYVPSQEGLLSLPAQSQECRGDTRRRAMTRGELDRAVEGQQPNSRVGICSFVQGGTGGALLEPYKMTSSGLLVCMFLTKLSWGWDEGPTSSCGTCANSPAPCSSVGICREHQNWQFASGAPFSSQRRAGSQLAHDRRERVWRRRGERYAACVTVGERLPRLRESIRARGATHTPEPHYASSWLHPPKFNQLILIFGVVLNRALNGLMISVSIDRSYGLFNCANLPHLYWVYIVILNAIYFIYLWLNSCLWNVLLGTSFHARFPMNNWQALLFYMLCDAIRGEGQHRNMERFTQNLPYDISDINNNVWIVKEMVITEAFIYLSS